MEDLLPPYTVEERSRELTMRSQGLRWRARRLCEHSRHLREKSGGLLEQLKEMKQEATRHSEFIIAHR